jgi:putative NADH-flavin reductase
MRDDGVARAELPDAITPYSRNRIMKIVVFGATGNVGQRVAAEALSRGHEVVGVLDELEHPKHVAKRFGVAY